MDNTSKARAMGARADLICPLEEIDPSGPNLEYDTESMELERAKAGKPEQVLGKFFRSAGEPDWANVGKRAEALLRRTRDLRVAVILTEAQLNTDGVRGFASGLRIIRGLLETQWDTTHPQLDPTDSNDPTLRINTIMTLADQNGICRWLSGSSAAGIACLGTN